MPHRTCNRHIDRAIQDAPPRLERFDLFVALFGCFVVLHELVSSLRWFGKGPWTILLGCTVMMAGAAIILRPRSAPWMGILLASWVLHKFLAMPVVPNHIFFTTVIGAAWLAALVLFLLQQGGRNTLAGTLDRSVAPAMRAGVIVLYGFAVLHKLNTDYLDPKVSCAPQEMGSLTLLAHMIPRTPWLDHLTIHASLLIEATIGVLLLVRRCRIPGIALGVAFHSMLALDGNLYVGSFTALMFALFALFLPAQRIDQLSDLASRWPRLTRSLRITPMAVAAVFLLAMSLWTWAMPDRVPEDPSHAAHTFVRPVVRIIIAQYALTVLFCFFYMLLTDRTPTDESGLFRMPYRGAMLVPVLLVFNGLCPYLGLKTQTAFSMFSNLRTEMRQTNHLFMPVSFRLADYQEHMVIVEETNSPRLRPYMSSQEWVPLFELRRAAVEDDRRDLRIAYRHVGSSERIVADRAASSDAGEVFDAPLWIEHKFLSFRAVPPIDMPCTCRH